MDDEWRNLLESSTNLNPTHSASRIKRSLKGIEKEAQRLSSKSSRRIGANQLKDFAAHAGVDIRNQSEYISSIDALSIHRKERERQREREKENKMSKHTEKQATDANVRLISGSMHPTNTMDLNNFLKFHHEYVISSTIQESQVLNCRHFEKKYIDSIEHEWQQTKLDILSYFGCNNHTQNNNNLNFKYNNMNNTGNNENHNEDTAAGKDEENAEMNVQIEERLSLLITDLCKYRNPSSPIIDFDRNNDQYIPRNNIFAPICSIASIHREIRWEYRKRARDGDNIQYLCDLWQCLSSMIFETMDGNGHLKENEYDSYHKNNDIGLQRLFVNGARKYLEKMYFDFIVAEIEKNKRFAKKGGKPGKRYIVTAFVRLQYHRGSAPAIPDEYKKIVIDNEVLPLWPLIYYSFRIGDMESALYFAKLDVTANIIEKALRNLREKMFAFTQMMYSSNKEATDMIGIYNLDSSIWKELDSFYKENVMRKSQDPFEIIMYILIGKLFMNESQELHHIINRQEDFLWFKLSTLYINKSAKPQWINIDTQDNKCVWIPSLSLSQLQNEIKQDIGPNQFNHRILFVIALILSQQFGDAVEYLALYHPLQSIHVGICLSYYGLLNMKRCKTNLRRNVMNYIQKFKHSQSREAQSMIFYYLYMMDDVDALVDFLCEPNTTLLQVIVGIISNESIDICNSLLYKYCGIAKFISICKLSAKRAYDNGEMEHCIKLYILCGDFNLSSQICIQLLCSHITDKAHNHSKQFIVNLGKHLFASNKQILQNPNFHSLSLIDESLMKSMDSNNCMNLIHCIHFAEFYDLFYEQQVDKALDIINVNGIIPISDQHIINRAPLPINTIIAPYKERVLKLDNELQKYVGEICVSVMQIFLDKFQFARNNKQIQNATNISTKCYIIYHFFNNLEDQIKPIGAGHTEKQISNLYFQTRMD